VLIRLLRTYLRPYRKPLAYLLVLQLAQTLATLYLPTLNADIIDNGVIVHNTHYILVTGGVMLAIALAQILCAIGAVHFGAQVAVALGRDVRPAVFGRVLMLSDREVHLPAQTPPAVLHRDVAAGNQVLDRPGSSYDYRSVCFRPAAGSRVA
jgi:ATP-binding cassette subfamily B protein